MINRVILTGRLTKDVDLSYTPSGVASAKFTLAVNRTFKSDGQPDADFINIQVWRKQAENAANFLKKGSLVGIDGRIQTGSYEKDGQRIYYTNVVAESVQFLEPRQNAQDSPNSNGNYQPSTNYQQNNQMQNTGSQTPNNMYGNPPSNFTEDDFPF